MASIQPSPSRTMSPDRLDEEMPVIKEAAVAATMGEDDISRSLYWEKFHQDSWLGLFAWKCEGFPN